MLIIYQNLELNFYSVLYTVTFAETIIMLCYILQFLFIKVYLFKCYNELKQKTRRLSTACTSRRNRVHRTPQKGSLEVRNSIIIIHAYPSKHYCLKILEYCLFKVFVAYICLLFCFELCLIKTLYNPVIFWGVSIEP